MQTAQTNLPATPASAAAQRLGDRSAQALAHQRHGVIATLSAPGFPASTLTMCDSSLGIGCTIKWGDGSTTIGDVTGTNATSTNVNSLYTIFGSHTYPHPGTYHGVVIVSAGNTRPVRAQFSVHWR